MFHDSFRYKRLLDSVKSHKILSHYGGQGMGLLAPLKTAGSVFGIRTPEEKLDYQVIHAVTPFEIRQYYPHLVARTIVKGDFEEAMEMGFDILSDYIFGQNTRRLEMPLTVPIWQERVDQGWSVGFYIPSRFSLETVPKPFNPNIIFEKRKAQQMACLRYSGPLDDESIQKHEVLLREWVEKKRDYVITGKAQSVQYDPPITIPFLRRNEIQARVMKINRV